MMKRKILVFAAVSVVCLIVIPLLLFFFPSLVGAKGAYIVQSGSMEPEIPQGSMIFVYSEAEEIEPGEIITFYSEINSGFVRMTHRVVYKSRAEGEYIYLTKGDALAMPDNEWIPQQNVIGKVRYVLPGLGTMVQKYRDYDLFIGSLMIISSVIIIESLRTVIVEKLG